MTYPTAKELRIAAASYLEWRKEPSAFVREPIWVLYHAVIKALKESGDARMVKELESLYEKEIASLKSHYIN